MDPGDPVLRAGDFEVHVPVMILVAHDVGHRDPLVVRFFNETDRDARDWVDNRHAGGHQPEGAAADGRHGA